MVEVGPLWAKVNRQREKTERRPTSHETLSRDKSNSWGDQKHRNGPTSDRCVDENSGVNLCEKGISTGDDLRSGVRDHKQKVTAPSVISISFFPIGRLRRL